MTQIIESPEGYTSPEPVDYSTTSPNYEDQLFMVYDNVGDVLCLLAYGDDEFAVNDGVSGWESNSETYPAEDVLDQPFRKIQKGLENRIIRVWEESEGESPQGIPWYIDQFESYFE